MYSPGRIFYMVEAVKKQQKLFRNSSVRHSRPAALASSFAGLFASLGLLRPISATGGGLRAPLIRLAPTASSIRNGRSTALASSLAALPCSLDSSAAIAATGCAASFVPLTQGSLLGAAAPYECTLSKGFSLSIGLPFSLLPPQAAAFVRPRRTRRRGRLKRERASALSRSPLGFWKVHGAASQRGSPPKV